MNSSKNANAQAGQNSGQGQDENEEKEATPVIKNSIGNKSSSSSKSQQTVEAFAALFKGRTDA